MPNLLSLYPEHPILSWRDDLFNTLPINAEWWTIFFVYLTEHATNPKEIGYTLARLFDLISKNQAPELVPIFPKTLSFPNMEPVLEGIYSYRLKLGNLVNRRIDKLPSFKLQHWNLVCYYADHLYDTASKILLWTWSKPFWVPHAFELDHHMPFRYMIGAMILKHADSSVELFTSIKQYWISNNLVFPHGDFFNPDISCKRKAWFDLICPEYTNTTTILFELASSLTLYQVYELLCVKQDSMISSDESLPEIFLPNF